MVAIVVVTNVHFYSQSARYTPEFGHTVIIYNTL